MKAKQNQDVGKLSVEMVILILPLVKFVMMEITLNTMELMMVDKKIDLILVEDGFEEFLEHELMIVEMEELTIMLLQHMH